MELADYAAIAQPEGGRILLLVMDGLGGLPLEPGGRTELETARTPNLDELVRRGECGLHDPVAAGVTPGSGPGHLALFGYDPLRYRVGRGMLAALGTGFDLRPGDIAARGNFCTLDESGRVADRRAGRIPTEESAPLAEELDQIRVEGARVFVRPVKEHRFLLVIRPGDTNSAPVPTGDVDDTDPGRTGEPPDEMRATASGGEPTARIVRAWLEAARARLAGRERANMVLLRGFSMRPDWPRFQDVFGLRSLAIAAYPMYRGVARLVGMDVMDVDDSLEALAQRFASAVASDAGTAPDPAAAPAAGTAPDPAAAPAAAAADGRHDFVFLHVKGTDKAGEDGDFRRKVAVIEALDAALPRFLEPLDLLRDVVLVTGDHSTPARLRSHSWHPVPFILAGGPGRSETVEEFGESACARGSIGRIRACHLMPLAVARAGRFAKFGA